MRDFIGDLDSQETLSQFLHFISVNIGIQFLSLVVLGTQPNFFHLAVVHLIAD